jgi:hypothetical protein
MLIGQIQLVERNGVKILAGDAALAGLPSSSAVKIAERCARNATVPAPQALVLPFLTSDMPLYLI